MTVDERERRHLQEAMVRSIGEGPADTLMAYLPPVGWADVATKQDLAVLETVLRADLRGEIGGLHREIGELRAELHSVLRTHLYWTVTLLVLLLTGFAAVIKLT